MSALQEDCKKGQKWVSCTLVVFQSAYMADIQCRLIIRRQVITFYARIVKTLSCSDKVQT